MFDPFFFGAVNRDKPDQQNRNLVHVEIFHRGYVKTIYVVLKQFKHVLESSKWYSALNSSECPGYFWTWICYIVLCN